MVVDTGVTVSTFIVCLYVAPPTVKVSWLALPMFHTFVWAKGARNMKFA